MISLHCWGNRGFFSRLGSADRSDLSPDLEKSLRSSRRAFMSGQRPHEKPHGLTFRSFAVQIQGERMGGKTLSEKKTSTEKHRLPG